MATGRTTIVDCGSTGRGNNWAYGYWDENGLEATLEAFRITLEKSDEHNPGCMLVHSVAGGTGSGLGSRILEELRAESLKSTIINCSILPFSSGETALQHYNSVLSLGWMQSLSDLILLFPNDVTMAAVTKQYESHFQRRNGSAGRKAEDRVSLTDINDYIAQAMAGLLLPTTPAERLVSGEIEHSKAQRFNFREFTEALVPDPGCKISSVFSSHIAKGADPNHGLPKNASESWSDVTTNLLKNIPTPYNMVKRTYIRSRLVVRGGIGPEFWPYRKALPSIPCAVNAIESKVKLKLGTPSPALDGVELDLRVSSCYTTDLKSKLRSLILCANTSDALHTVEPI
ncbi:Tubulin/FtsZ family, GTPase domain-containing protein [Chytridium lagenaria]|nr:Tubulin/FtsZ family, GTPase domain-containing protein [Chytridium lagenaria]